MSLTRGAGPLDPAGDLPSNYRIDGPEHRLLLVPFPRRVRAELGGRTVLDTGRGAQLHETGLLPSFHVPVADLPSGLLEDGGPGPSCPYKGTPTRYALRVGDTVVPDAVWVHDAPAAAAGFLRGWAGLRWDAVDRWLDEDDETTGPLPDPFHRVDVRATGRRVRVRAGERVVADSTDALVMSETGHANCYYLPPADVDGSVLVPSATRTVCPYKGRTRYWSVAVDGHELTDAAWSYPDPVPESARVAGYHCFAHDGLVVEVDPG